MNPLDKKLTVCKWHQCEIGFRYHHTGEQWDLHQQYSKIDIPKFFQKDNVEDVENDQIRLGAMPLRCGTGLQSNSKSDSKTMFWRGLAIGALIITWTVILVTILR